MSLTATQQKAVAARGNVLVMAGAGTGKTSTLVARCVDCLGSGDPPASLEQLLVVTFTEAAAAEARERIRAALDQKFAETGAVHWAQQLALFDTAHIGTLHAFCFQLVRQHFYQLGLDPQLAILDAGEARLLAEETLTGLFDELYAGRLPDSTAVQQLIETHAAGRDESIHRLVLRLHAYGQTRPDPAEWLARQIEMFSATDPAQWQEWLLLSVAAWREVWRPDLELLAPINPKAEECRKIFGSLSSRFDRAQAAAVIQEILTARNGPWPKGKTVILRKPLEDLFADAEFLASLAPGEGTDPLVEDWNWSRGAMLALLNLTAQFTARFQERKRTDGTVDFHDLEQLALLLLWERAPRQPSAIARHWREKIRFIFVDEYQDINAAQDQIITALSRDESFGAPPSGGATTLPLKGGTPNPGNRFLVGDVKQSIYRFRLADPGIFRGYARDWRGEHGQTIPLAENFRSRAGILEFVNAVFASLMREEVGGLNYDAEARLILGLKPDGLHVASCVKPPANGSPSLDAKRKTQDAAPDPDVEILFRLTERTVAAAENDADALDDLQSAEKEARHIAFRLRELKSAGQLVLDRETKQPRPVEWRDMAVLLRAPANKAEGYAKQFERASVPLEVARTGFYESLEVADLLNVLRLLDNPLQDVPLLAVLRSPLVALNLDELATIRLATRGHFWTALVKWRKTENPKSKVQSLKSEAHVHASRFTNHAPTLLAKTDQLLERFARWRNLARQGSLSNCLDAVLVETHYADWLRAQARGAQRQANVQRLLGLAEKFDQFQRQGLFRFLRFIEAQQAAGEEPEVAVSGEGDSVRLMSIHQSKGLEFPVVVVADLGKQFNFQDLRAEIILDETYGLCPQVKPPQTGARYPSLSHWLARRRQERELLGEELRLLYVAMTRARDRLILTGSMSHSKWESLAVTWPGVTPRALLAAKSCAEWLRLWHAHHATAAAQLFCWRELDDVTLRTDEGATIAPREGKPAPELDDATLKQLRAKLAWDCPFGASSERAAKTSVTALRRQAEAERGEESERLFVPKKIRAARAKRGGKLSAADVGTAHHQFLQHVSLASVSNVKGLKMEAQRFACERLLTTVEAAVLDLAAIAAFWQSDVGHMIRDQGVHVRRELAFTARFAPAELDEIICRPGGAGSSDEFVVVQGVADLAVLLPDEIWLLDFKTDQVKAGEVETKVKTYAPQLRLYAFALERIYGRRVTRGWLHFLACGTTAPVSLSVRTPSTTRAV